MVDLTKGVNAIQAGIVKTVNQTATPKTTTAVTDETAQRLAKVAEEIKKLDAMSKAISDNAREKAKNNPLVIALKKHLDLNA